ncbi:hemerythrin domain-containing protein [Actinoplanes sp. TBRC 11911]|uniref:hemerythrin domain-containing protein n=1 Tax=Actinoplanes sp. TBRC 11911 TaxID=2729386 RepID=UPI00145E52A4|nr:hemerythrin domain-containing protein [Actinoplanes sp. TBRC 11911]NMO57568.1 hemerythrin domain-containing protein [Actinoplanes sp. TBRC 11911]
MTNTKVPGAMTREMVMVHTAFRREFGFMPELVHGVFEGDRHRAEIISDHIELISSVLHRHHHGEDMHIWPRLLERCPEEILPLVHGMEGHHEKIAAYGEDLTKQIAAWRTDAGVAHRDAVLHTLEDLLPILTEHLGMEERFVLPLIEKHISADEWDGMVAEGAGETPPEQLPLMFGIIMYEGAPSAVQDALNNIPEEARPVITEAAPRLYGDYAERVYGTRTPPFGSSRARTKVS